MDYRQTAVEILNAVGGSENVVSAAHCATRLRLVIADDKKVDKKTLERACSRHRASSRSFWALVR